MPDLVDSCCDCNARIIALVFHCIYSLFCFNIVLFDLLKGVLKCFDFLLDLFGFAAPSSRNLKGSARFMQRRI